MVPAPRVSPLFAFALASLLSACSGAVEQTEPPATPAPTDPAAPRPTEEKQPPKATLPFEIAWGSCAIPYGGRSIEAECATVDAPAQRDVPNSGTTQVAVYRLKAKKQPATAQMWFLNGGPGGAGFGLAPFGQMVTSLEQGIDAYLVDHRGTGASAYLDCPRALRTATTPAAYAAACSKEIRDAYGARVDGFSTTESAHDVRELIDSTAAPEQKVFVYGGSYGSYWTHRLLQLPDVRVDAVVTDGNCLGATCSFDEPQTFGVDEVMKYILDACKDAPACAAKLGPDPFAFVKGTLDKLAAGHCSQARLAQLPPADLAMAIGPMWAAGLPPVYYRLDRCNVEDVTALDTLAGKLEELGRSRLISTLPVLGPTPKPAESESFSQTLQLHVIASEMISRPAPAPSVLAAQAAELTFKPGTDSFDLSYFDAWAPYSRDEHVGGWVKRDVPWLLMQGTFDFQTVFSLSTEAMKNVQDPSIQLVRVDGGGHGVVFASECSLAMLEAFLKDPKAKVDSSCTATVKATALDTDPAYTDYFFGRASAWD